MRFTTFSYCPLLANIPFISAGYGHGHDKIQAEASKQIDKWQDQYDQYIKTSTKHQKVGCTSQNIVYRQEWGSLSERSRKDYIKAVQCLQSKPPRSTKEDVPGARSRYDDFSATHIKVTPYVHFSGLFLHFHRYLVYLYEKALREECGYKGYQPYWDWTLSWEDPRKSSVFNGSPTSMGSNGAFIPNRTSTTISAFVITLDIPSATGGGCISGPFSNDYTVNLGPIAYAPYGPDHGLGYNPRCLSRDISTFWSNNTKPSDVVKLIKNSPDLGTFDTNLEALDGVHAGGHFSMGGLGLDAYASAGDPAFWLHHAMVDKVWGLWQSLNAGNRTKMVHGTGTAFNTPPSANITLDTVVDFGILAPKRKICSLISTIEGTFCYAYV
ncbi:hypothetical protein BHYA_0175g00240 [Botrytis hyacinthi]|uniref:Tyrosinase copper-binding domain-containing protein n=1 Tax=Botrytis hyacinthi TaxID=278943 RepID=A0A4Z1GKH1_9HELO|nr:hypothetical protein BHYA_0175g00240 [Botrytis hyacinthi]